MIRAYYNEWDGYTASWLRNLVDAGHIPYGDVDERSITDVRPSDLKGYSHCHFFAGIGGWAYASRLACWPDDRPLWTGSCPCQGESVSGKKLGANDPRHLWPSWFSLISVCRPPIIMGEQVSRAVGTHWLDGTCDDFEKIHYSSRPIVVPACAVDSPQQRDRVWFVAHPQCKFSECQKSSSRYRSEETFRPANQFSRFGSSYDGASGWGKTLQIFGSDKKARRIKPGLRLLAYGIPSRVERLRAYGNAIVPQIAEQMMRSYLETMP